MSDYALNRENKKKKITNGKLPIEGIEMQPKLRKHKSLIEIKKITVTENEMQTTFLLKQFNHYYRKLIALMIDVTESSNSTASDCAIVLNEVAKIKSMIEHQAIKSLKRSELEKLYKKLALVEGKIQNKLLEIQSNQMIQQMMNYEINEKEEEKGKSR